MTKVLHVRIIYDPEAFSPSDVKSKIVEALPGTFAKLGLSAEDEDALQLAGEAKALLGGDNFSLHEMSHLLTEFAEDARTVAELLMEDRPFTPAARRILRRLRGRPKSPGSLEEAEEELEYLKARREYADALLKGDQSPLAQKFLGLEKSRLADKIGKVEANIQWLKEE